MQKPIRIYCDTATLKHNMRHNDAKTRSELNALKKLLSNQSSGKYVLGGSLAIFREVEKTKNDKLKSNLAADFHSLERVPKDQRLLGFNTVFDHLGGFTSSPMISDIYNEELRDKLTKRGLSKSDADHLAQAISNEWDVFLTRDEKSIIKKHRTWIEADFQIKVCLPSELVIFLGL